jgi:hypothetical protein
VHTRLIARQVWTLIAHVLSKHLTGLSYGHSLKVTQDFIEDWQDPFSHLNGLRILQPLGNLVLR